MTEDGLGLVLLQRGSFFNDRISITQSAVFERVSLFDGMERWNGTVEWNDGMEWNDHAHRARYDDLLQLCLVACQ